MVTFHYSYFPSVPTESNTSAPAVVTLESRSHLQLLLLNISSWRETGTPDPLHFWIKIAIGYSVAATFHVGNALGARNPQQAVNSAKVTIYCIGCIALVTAAIIGALRNVVGYIFTSDKEILHLVIEVVPLCSAFHVFDATAVSISVSVSACKCSLLYFRFIFAFQSSVTDNAHLPDNITVTESPTFSFIGVTIEQKGVCGGVLRGAGKQKQGAFGNLVEYYLIGFPIGISLMFAANLGVFGLWCGIVLCASVQSIIFLTVICRLDWKKTAKQAQINAGAMRGLGTSDSTSGGQTKDLSTEEDTGNDAMVLMSSVLQLEPSVDKDQVMDESSFLETGVTTVGEILSTKQMIIRRGLFFLSGPVILAIGLTIHFILAKDM
ncbi:multidrug and toxin extrusion protein 2-like isoform X2 [Stegostoma tigrinum]|uniref:multidrug and toxin extrusion protein 2-like isoform X2 n=1 Tax=Stegostoma tigrinum TaxID=3053191 RepID=UPI00287009A3|nr:multidrug and toxin extrusion protein 2-like isoform X2 [Stegostoma tigrinum]